MTDDAQVRLAAFRFLEEQRRLAADEGVLPRKLLVGGFVYEGERVPLMGPQGIFKPRVLRDIPLSITTVAVVEGETRPYDDAFGEDGLLRYRYRGTDPQHHENVGLRLALQRRAPLVYFHGIVPGLYVAEWPVYIVGDEPERLTFTVSVDDRRFASLRVPWTRLSWRKPRSAGAMPRACSSNAYTSASFASAWCGRTSITARSAVCAAPSSSMRLTSCRTRIRTVYRQ